MKTLEETYDWVATESGYSNKAEMFYEIAGDEDLVEFYMRLVATKYAEEAVEECAETAIRYGMISHGGVTHESILKVKEELK